ncbi:MAG TPA: M48 family metallopeptidase [Bacteroidales bacterium]|jgi:predicted Zn-dependent protease|nr:M48 family metallopeptidase [Bacteroidales bacterium]
MQKKLIFQGILLIFIFGSIWGIFALIPIWPEKKPSMLSVEKEEKLGNLLLKATLADPGIREIENDSITNALDSIEKRLTTALENSQYNYRIIVVRSEMANAFALPGGYVLITDRLISLMESPGECAAVLAHEIGHIEKRHTLSKLLANFTAAVIFGDNALATEAAELLATSAYSRRQEETADRFGLNLLEKSGINPHLMGTAFRHLKEESEYFDIKMEIIMSHPDIDKRIKEAYDYKVASDFNEVAFDINWKSVKNSLTPPKFQ